MGRKQIVTGILGICVGFVLGFFLARFLDQPAGAGGSLGASPAPGAGADMPEGHPPLEVVEKLQELQERARSHPEDKELRITLGNLYYDMGRFDAAVQWYEEALQLEPKNVNVRTDLATSYLYTGFADKAIELYRASLQIEPDHPQTLQNLGFAYFATERFSEAIETWQKLLDSHPEYPYADQIQKHIENAKAHLEGEHS